MIGSVARRYAKAIFGIARDTAKLEQTATELRALSAIASDPSIRAVIANPMLPPSKRRRVADLILEQTKPGDGVVRFVQLLSERQRLDELPAISREFARLHDQFLGRVQLSVRSAQPLATNQQQQVAGAFAKLTGKSVVPAFEIDPGLLGGVVVEAEGKVYDGSIKTQLERLAKELSEVA